LLENRYQLMTYRPTPFWL